VVLPSGSTAWLQVERVESSVMPEGFQAPNDHLYLKVMGYLLFTLHPAIQAL